MLLRPNYAELIPCIIINILIINIIILVQIEDVLTRLFRCVHHNPIYEHRPLDVQLCSSASASDSHIIFRLCSLEVCEGMLTQAL